MQGDQRAVKAVFMRGGTSKALVFRREDLPADRAEQDAIFLAAMGSPDPYGRQLDGMGGGLSSLSKVCIVERSKDAGADIDYTFGQVEVGKAMVDYRGSCGSMATAMGPFAADEGIIEVPHDGEATVRIRDVNAGTIIVSRFLMRGGRAAVDGPLSIDGVAGTGAPVRLDFMAPGGKYTGKLLPTGVSDVVEVAGVGPVEYTFVDAANPVMFVAAERLGLAGGELPDQIDGTPGLLAKIETIRRHVTVKCGAAPHLEAAADVSLPRIALVAGGVATKSLSGRAIAESEADITVRAVARGLTNRAVPVTGALCLAVACRIPGTVPHRLLSERAKKGGDIVVNHPSGLWTVRAEVEQRSDGPFAVSAGTSMTMRRLFQGEVLAPLRAAQGADEATRIAAE